MDLFIKPARLLEASADHGMN